MPCLRRQGALDQGRNLAALPGRQHVAESPGNRDPDQGVQHALHHIKDRARPGVEHLHLQQAQHRGGDGRDQVFPDRKGVGQGLCQRGHEQHQQWCDVRVQQQASQHTANQGAEGAAVAPLQRLRQAAAQHHHDGDQYPVIMTAPG